MGARRLIRAALKRLGYDLHSVRELGRGWDVVLAHLKALGFEPVTLVDVGVAWGTPVLYRHFPNARKIFVEPLRQFEPDLRRYHADTVWAAVADQAGERTMHVYPNPGHSTLFGADPSAVDQVVPVTTLDHIRTDLGIAGPCLLKLDIQGGELAALKGGTNLLETTEVVIAEASLFHYWPGGTDFAELLCWLKEHGFVLYDICSGGVRPLDDALGGMDVVFVKEHGPLRQSHAYDRPRSRRKPRH